MAVSTIPAAGLVSPLTTATITTGTITTLNEPSGVFATQNGMTGIAKAWVYFNAPSGTVTINGSFNVASVTNVSTGVWAINFTTAMPNTNYAVIGSAGGTSNTIGDRQLSTYPNTTSSCNVVSGVTASGTVYNATNICVAIFSS